jgi:hypothetical protein
VFEERKQKEWMREACRREGSMEYKLVSIDD